ncbi:MAG: sulfotransferase [Coleofasciculus chthonoplastes F3-SA18-01]
MIMPNFLIIGAAKTGTTSLYRYLKQHPQIYMSPAKEPKFFAYEGETLNFCGPDDSEEAKSVVTHIDAYQALFNKVTNEIAIGEASTIYLYSPNAVKRIKHYIPHVKLITMLRNPIDRAYSNFLHLVYQGREPLTDFAQALAQEEQRILDNWWPFWHYKKRGLYYVQLKRYVDVFERDQIKVYIYEDFQNNLFNILPDIFQFLEVNETFIPCLSERVRESRRAPKNKTLYALFNKPNPIKSMLKPLFSEKLRQQVTFTVNNGNLVKPKVSQEVRKQLVEFYREDILELQELLQRDLSKWLEY